ncbi:2-oxoglutarate dehydrogenase E1 component [Sanyastnella coralliicola]|uniref:2-oxoglutarate dehydrogenase E1 component n=1 Tax=Sanyastnella coralliicola TaxID=3069118 RepID=UPI0027BB0AD5|nr:2-oxoglutarate dehydrogenase E1 component [Longitalea sp. SCSIO 12813]
MDDFSYLSNGDVNAIEALYQQYRKDPQSVDEGWKKFFEGFEFAQANYEDGGAIPENVQKEFKVINLIDGYRSRGHLFTLTNPVRQRRQYSPTLDLENFGLSDADLDTEFEAGEQVGIGKAKLRDIVEHLQMTYCQHIGIEYMYMRKPEHVEWMRNKIEIKNRPKFTTDEKKHFFKKINQATVFEQFLQKKFVGQKRFSVEGNESLVAAIDDIVETGSRMGAKEFVVGMAHRGRLNTLAHIFGKPYDQIFSEFEGKEYDDDGVFDGDVKYHLGYSTDVVADSGEKVHLTLCPNPSHLEAVDPVVEGLVRSKIDEYLHDEKAIVPILIHGDAAISGQGVVYEVVQMAQLDGYRTGGTIHIVVNNQIGFTTNYLDGRSSTYCTDVGKVTLSPVFHVNADDVEAVIQTVRIAMEFRQTFGRDVFIDLLGYRKYGHNEGDEPKFTQPQLYKAIAAHDTPREIYLQQLIGEGVYTAEDGTKLRAVLEEELNAKFDASKEISRAYVKHFLEETWKGYQQLPHGEFDPSPKTGVPKKKLLELAERIAHLPEDKKFFRKTKKLMADREKMIAEDRLDWSMGELLAYASLLDEKHPVRISGQDVERGTFSHRHAVVKTEDTEEEFISLNHVSDKQAQLTIYNSLLSEYAVLGFEYGYAFGVPNGLTIWEAQFGDFFNGAQITIDQFISAAEDKWRTMNGLVMLLPHGYEGMGSEHSSGRMERFLQLCAENNMCVANCTNPANFFHLLRRQVKREYRKPLIVFTPKKLLRYPKAVSKLADLTKGGFQEVIDDASVNAKDVDTVALCSGKIYYDILEHKEKTGAGDNIAVVRLEQLYPLPEEQLDALVKKYGEDCKYIWVQEEPENMGAWSYMLRKYRKANLDVIARVSSGSPAAGSPVIHAQRQQAILDRLFENAKVKA